jgi:hypothetical protein
VTATFPDAVSARKAVSLLLDAPANPGDPSPNDDPAKVEAIAAALWPIINHRLDEDGIVWTVAKRNGGPSLTERVNRCREAARAAIIAGDL